MKRLQLSQGQEAIVCDCHYYLVQGKKWHFKPDGKSGYAEYTQYLGGGRANIRNDKIKLHRLVAGAAKGQIVDHINGDKLDNRCENLRIVSQQINIVNRGKQSNNTSGYRGVQYRKDRHKWMAIIGQGGKYRRLGLFNTPEEASVVYEAERAKVWSGAVS